MIPVVGNLFLQSQKLYVNMLHQQTGTLATSISQKYKEDDRHTLHIRGTNWHENEYDHTSSELCLYG